MGLENRQQKEERGKVEINFHDCKGCGLCISACSVNVIGYSEQFNAQGYRPAVYLGSGCTGCGICFYVCPEPGAITVYRAEKTTNSSQA
jgi:2-oxoglutarate ferredoxin oxidoreductase subunit delta